MHFLTDPLQYLFIQRAIMSAVIIGLLCACLGTFVVLRRMAVVGHALTHSALPGLVIAYLMGGNLMTGALAATVATAFGIGFLSRDESVYEDTMVGMVPNVMFAFGVLLISTSRSFRDLFSMLFGNILGITAGDLHFIIVIAVVSLFFILLFFKELKLFSVDPNYAQTIGMPVKLMHYGLLFFLSLTVVAGIQAIGTVLTNALLVIPVAAARILTDRLKFIIMLSCVFAVVSAIGGIYFSYYIGSSSGASIVMFAAVIFGIVWVYKFIRTSI
ncbi:MAG: metal ABC transporter permease [Candidatus Omnitrophica bacterium]|nr:metal ABC transporter permease [Candidatus Omnitrophota bacterium]MDE2222886.1 metal ABC transporter permease [Candidatus Omnitrophota bacterium]